MGELRQERAQDEELVQDKIRTLSSKGKLGPGLAFLPNRATHIPSYNRASAISPNMSVNQGTGASRQTTPTRKSGGLRQSHSPVRNFDVSNKSGSYIDNSVMASELNPQLRVNFEMKKPTNNWMQLNSSISAKNSLLSAQN